MTKRILTGTICKATNKKTVVVEVERTFKHPIYKKYIKRSKKYHAHDETDALVVGDKVMIEETKPISKLKTWKVISNEKRSWYIMKLTWK